MKTAVIISQAIVLLGASFMLYFMGSVLIYIKKRKETDKAILEKLDSILESKQ